MYFPSQQYKKYRLTHVLWCSEILFIEISWLVTVVNILYFKLAICLFVCYANHRPSDMWWLIVGPLCDNLVVKPGQGFMEMIKLTQETTIMTRQHRFTYFTKVIGGDIICVPDCYKYCLGNKRMGWMNCSTIGLRCRNISRNLFKTLLKFKFTLIPAVFHIAV